MIEFLSLSVFVCFFQLTTILGFLPTQWLRSWLLQIPSPQLTKAAGTTNPFISLLEIWQKVEIGNSERAHNNRTCTPTAAFPLVFTALSHLSLNKGVYPPLCVHRDAFCTYESESRIHGCKENITQVCVYFEWVTFSIIKAASRRERSAFL